MDIDDSFVDPHLKAIPRLRALAALSLATRDTESLGRHPDWTLYTEIQLRSFDEVTAQWGRRRGGERRREGGRKRGREGGREREGGEKGRDNGKDKRGLLSTMNHEDVATFLQTLHILAGKSDSDCQMGEYVSTQTLLIHPWAGPSVIAHLTPDSTPDRADLRVVDRKG